MIIYVIKNNVRNKYYVGQTTLWIQRKSRHKRDLILNQHCNSYLQNSWNKHGKQCFDFIVLERCNSIKELNSREKYWIKKLQSHHTKNGYNIEWGGKNNIVSESTKLKSRKTNARIRGIDIKQLDKETNKVIKIYHSIMEASRQTNTHEYSIRRVLDPNKPNCKTAGGYNWETV